LRNRIVILSWSLAVAVAGFFALLVMWFGRSDFYYSHFFDHGTIVQHYLWGRLAFAVFMAWLIYAPGVAVVRVAAQRDEWDDLLAPEQFALAFLLGASIWNVLLFEIGLSGHETRRVVFVLTLTVMALSVPHLASCIRRGIDGCRRLAAGSTVHLLVITCGVVLLAVVSGLFLLVKTSYPAGGHDYYTHYFSFYRRVVESGSIRPNEVWYHFYYSKGAGLFFAGMLLTDALAPALITTCFVAVGACLTFAMLKRGTNSTTLAWIGAVLFIALLIYTPGPDENRRNGGWADLEKHHEITAIAVFGMIWLTSRLCVAGRAVTMWIAGLIACVVLLAVITLQLVFLAGLYLMGFVAWFAWRRQFAKAAGTCVVCVTAMLSVVVIAAINYHYTGLLLDQWIVLSWPIANLQKITDWGVMFEVIATHWAYTGLAKPIPWDWSALPLVVTSLRWELLWPVLAAGVPFAVLAVSTSGGRRRLRQRWTPSLFWPLIWFSSVTAIVALFGGGRAQPISFYRLTSFCFGPTLCLALAWYALIMPRVSSPAAAAAAVTLGVAGAGMSYATVMRVATRAIEIAETGSENIVVNASHLWHGRFSLKEAYQNQQGWPGRMPWGGIYPPMETVWRIVGSHTRIVSFHIHSYCMLPGCNVETLSAFRFSRHWSTVYFDTPQRAAEVLHQEGTNYFFFSKELQIFSTLPAAPVFSPDHISEQLGVRWTDGTSYLLTWIGPETKPLDAAVVAAYAMAVEHAPGGYQGFIGYQKDWKAVSRYLSAHPDPRPFLLPWCTACEGLPKVPE
jgi:hypothetical protein